MGSDSRSRNTDFEKMLLRKLHSMNVLNTLLMIHLGQIAVTGRRGGLKNCW